MILVVSLSFWGLLQHIWGLQTHCSKHRMHIQFVIIPYSRSNMDSFPSRLFLDAISIWRKKAWLDTVLSAVTKNGGLPFSESEIRIYIAQLGRKTKHWCGAISRNAKGLVPANQNLSALKSFFDFDRRPVLLTVGSGSGWILLG